MDPRFGQLFQCGHVSERVVYGLIFFFKLEKYNKINGFRKKEKPIKIKKSNRFVAISDESMQNVEKFPVNQLIAIQVKLERIEPERQSALLETSAKYNVAHMFLFGRTLHLIDGFYQARILF